MERIDVCLIALRRILRATDAYARELAQSAGLTAVQFRALQLIAETGQITATRIAQRMLISQATVTALVDKLVRKGLVTREKSSTDRRQTNIILTELGRATVDNAPDPLQQQFVKRFEALEDWEQSMLVASLERVALMLNAADLDVAPLLDSREIRPGG
ncbi:MarR family winged helix-turn-helix transcriptional regulator [Roseovarius amoyensis]|uniref:MarR family winged helix-turn-helix transcriptional regulator n=1 Tax=Roseovarius amoyensis TaxID=2211448 RepID=UPI000DBEA070|nr:MarR family transcriptional regulator [Roseovarius amoyensis]